jgi:cation diffusion facilitator CzcD-associated flavoprotein CzcO
LARSSLSGSAAALLSSRRSSRSAARTCAARSPIASYAPSTPHYRFGCKRPILSNAYYPALTRQNVEVVAGEIERVEGRELVTRDGTRRELDTIITAIGYRYNRSLLVDRLIGMGGRTLGEVWNRSPRAYLGTAVPGFRTSSSCSARTRSESTP